jgi:hypothetical protein
MPNDSGGETLRIDNDAGRQRREWEFERAGWTGIGVLVLLGLAGFFGGGPLAHAAATSPDGRDTLRYDRVVRLGTAHRLSLVLAPRGSDTMAVVTLDRAMLDVADVTRVTPEPAETRASPDAVEYHVRRSRSSRPMVVDFAVTPEAPGIRYATIGTPAGSFTIRQFVLP